MHLAPSHLQITHCGPSIESATCVDRLRIHVIDSAMGPTSLETNASDSFNSGGLAKLPETIGPTANNTKPPNLASRGKGPVRAVF